MTTDPRFDNPQAFKMARVAYLEVKRELDNTPRHLLNEGNPNHPMYDLHIFGYHVDEFMRKQYK